MHIKKWPGCTLYTAGRDGEDRLNAALELASGLIEAHGGNKNAVRRVRERIHPDVVMLADSEEAIKVDDIRDIKRESFDVPHEGGAKVFIIPEAQRMTPQAQSSLLLITEEPPERVFFILTAPDIQSVLPTVLSRCTVFRLSGQETEKPEEDDATAELAKELALLFAEGSEYMIARFTWNNQKLKKNEAAGMLKAFLLCLRDAAAISSGADELVREDEVSKKLARSLTLEEIGALMKTTNSKFGLLERNVAPSHILSALAAEYFTYKRKRET